MAPKKFVDLRAQPTVNHSTDTGTTSSLVLNFIWNFISVHTELVQSSPGLLILYSKLTPSVTSNILEDSCPFMNTWSIHYFNPHHKSANQSNS
uniref:Uncharacterized protein n=1 Tax=Megaselia scalaris TaxID=36166 RepID=T1GK25_MEGSC